VMLKRTLSPAKFLLLTPKPALGIATDTGPRLIPEGV
jgi:hypothetical protein